MSLPDDFNKIFGSTATGGLTPINDVNYAKGWEFVGANPPTKNDFTYLQNLTDQRLLWLYENYNAGRLIGVKTFFTSGTYTPTAGTNRVIVEMVGGGGGGAGSRAADAGNLSIGGAGGAGAYVKAQFTSGFSGVNVTVGSGGLGGTTSNPYASSGGASSFGSLVSAAGGDSGKPAGPSNSFPFSTVAATVSAGVSGSGIIFGTPGEGAAPSIALSAAISVSSPGGSSHFGAGGFITAYGAKGIDGAGYGAGGGPVATSTGSPNTALAGGNGSPGLVIIWEYA